MEKKTVLILGATGLVGGECLTRLLNSDFYNRIVILTRRPLPDYLNHPKTEQHLIDFDHADKYQHLIKADHVICTLGTTIRKAGTKENFYKIDFTYPHRIASIAQQNRASHFLVVSANGANPKSPFFYNRVKGELEAAIQKLNYRSVSIFRPSLLLGERENFRLGEEIGKFLNRFISFAISERYKPVHGGAVADAVLQVARKDQAGVRIIESDEIQAIAKENRGNFVIF
ncbi:oxidoreductase [Desulfonema magnum]|uniref:NAD(P)-binding domain-containing protein n=1 Tax=Desulfonema magnum TaxID=45655 RepID=A0A975BGQ5_9BACT|nr:oxidoreductase [Desulfonema magnum]QTA85207.1 NAD(P)-binding domain-containing protein [Desulfonema magnum]